jgi:hypothetical protein
MITRGLHVENFRRRVLQDALNEALVSYWLKRAADLAKALHRTGDYPGRRTAEELEEHNRQILLAIRNIEHKIALLRQNNDVSFDVIAALKEAA